MAYINSVNHVELGFTSNATTQTILSHTASENSSGYFTISGTARRISDGASKAWSMNGVFKRSTGSASVSVELLGNLGSSTDLLALLTTAVSVDTSGADVRVRITGLASTDIQWYAEMLGQEMVIE